MADKADRDGPYRVSATAASVRRFPGLDGSEGQEGTHSGPPESARELKRRVKRQERELKEAKKLQKKMEKQAAAGRGRQAVYEQQQQPGRPQPPSGALREFTCRLFCCECLDLSHPWPGPS